MAKSIPKHKKSAKWQILNMYSANKSLITVFVCYASIVTMLLTNTFLGGSFAAFTSGGNLKGVAFAGEYFFSSDYLQSIKSEKFAEGRTVSCKLINNSISFSIFNYGAENVPNAFDISYRIKIKLAETDENYTYTVENKTLSADSWTQIGNKFLLKKSKKNLNTFTVKIQPGVAETDSKAYKNIIVVATPISPEYMTNYILGASLMPESTSGEFNVTGSFTPEKTDVLSNIVAFQYTLDPSGEWTGTEPAWVSVTWDSYRLELSKNSKYSQNGSNDDFKWKVETVNDKNKLTITAKSGANFEDKILFTFYRKNNFDVKDYNSVKNLISCNCSNT